MRPAMIASPMRFMPGVGMRWVMKDGGGAGLLSWPGGRRHLSSGGPGSVEFRGWHLKMMGSGRFLVEAGCPG